MGMARTFQNIRLFSTMSVLDNVRVPMQAFARTGLVSGLLGLRGSRSQEREMEERSMELLALVGLRMIRDGVRPDAEPIDPTGGWALVSLSIRVLPITSTGRTVPGGLLE